MEEEIQEVKHDYLDEAKLIAERIEAANKVTEELVMRQEKMKVREIIGGRSEAGTAPVEPDKNDSARAMLKGTGYDDILFPKEDK